MMSKAMAAKQRKLRVVSDGIAQRHIESLGARKAYLLVANREELITTARKLGIDPSTLEKFLRKKGVKKPESPKPQTYDGRYNTFRQY